MSSLSTGIVTQDNVELRIGDKVRVKDGCDAIIKWDERDSEPIAFIKSLGIAVNLRDFVRTFNDIRIRGNVIIC